MNTDDEKRNTAETVETMAALVLFGQLSTVGLILALAERRALDSGRVFAFYRSLAGAMETPTSGSGNAAKIAARMLRDMESIATEMTTLPVGGRA